MAKAAKKPPITFDKKASSPFSDKLRQGPKASSGPKMSKPANSNAKPKPSVTFKDKPASKTPFTDKLGKGSKAASTAAKTESIALKVATTGGRMAMKTAARIGGALALPLDMVVNAQPAGEGSDKPSGPLMKGNKGAGELRKKGAGTYTKPYDKPAGKSGFNTFGKAQKAYAETPLRIRAAQGKAGTLAPSLPSASGSEGIGGSGPRRGYQAPSAAPATTSGDPKFSKGSAKNPGAGTANMTGTTEKRGAVSTLLTGGLQSKTQRDGLAMDQRKRK